MGQDIRRASIRILYIVQLGARLKDAKCRYLCQRLQLTLMVATMLFRSGGGTGAEPQTDIGSMFGLAYR